jgi:probable F420-dependent oxidoreductase
MLLQFGVALPNLGFGMDPRRSMEHRDLVLAAADQAEALGFDSVWLGDHLALPRAPSAPYPYAAQTTYLQAESPLLDPIATAAVVAGRTKRIKLGFGVLVAPYRHPLVVAKLLSTLDVLSGGRVILGVGAGWMPEEFQATGVPFAQRGKMTDEWIAYVRAAWTQDFPEFKGRFYQLAGMSVLPRPLQGGGIPILVGGNTPAALRRAALQGDGWDTLHALPEALAPRLAELRRMRSGATLGALRVPPEREQHGLERKPFLVSVRGGPLRLSAQRDDSPQRTPLSGTREQVIETLRQFEAMGVTNVVLGTDTKDRRASLAAMERFAKEVRPAFR